MVISYQKRVKKSTVSCEIYKKVVLNSRSNYAKQLYFHFIVKKTAKQTEKHPLRRLYKLFIKQKFKHLTCDKQASAGRNKRNASNRLFPVRQKDIFIKFDRFFL